jgi:hypothetical protein
MKSYLGFLTRAGRGFSFLFSPVSWLVCCVWGLAALAAGQAHKTVPAPSIGSVQVDATASHVLNAFDPDRALGSSMDVLSRRDIDLVYTPHIVEESLSAGWGPITYRNNTELRMAAWHWTENGTWSDAAHKSGYFTGSTELKEPTRYILAYALPHRGFSTSGDAPIAGPNLTYWKSNPYLTSRFTGESDAAHPQWVVVDLKAVHPVNTVRIAWASTYAVEYRVEYWVAGPAKGGTPEPEDTSATPGDALDFDRGPSGEWRTFAGGVVKNGKGGVVTLKVGASAGARSGEGREAPSPLAASLTRVSAKVRREPGAPSDSSGSDATVETQFVRVWMIASSNTCDEHGSGDVRNCTGYAIREIHVGTMTGEATSGGDTGKEGNAAGTFTDAVDAAAEKQPSYTSSSIDPWHEASDVNDSGKYQHTGFDLFFTSGITNGLPAMIPVTMLYGTPEDSAAEIAYVEKRGYPVAYVEMGEEPDGKHMLPEDYAALYLQWATALHKVDPHLKLGGPVFEGVNEDIRVWPDARGRTSWMGRFVDYLKTHGRIADLAFVSFEHYPFEPCAVTWKSLYSEPQLIKHILDVWRADGVPKEVPLMVTENHLAANLTGPMSTIFAGLWLADNVGAFFEGGGAAFYHSPIQPQPVENSCLGWASWSNFVADRDYNITGYTSLYYAAHLINREWAQHRSGIHQMFPSTSDVKDSDGSVLVTSYALRRPDGNWSVMLVNRDQTNAHTVRVSFQEGAGGRPAFFLGPVRMVTFGSEQYEWKNDGANSHADPDGPPVGTSIAGGARATVTLPKASITVLRGLVEGLGGR